MRQTPSMHSLKTFESAARLLSFKKAAEELFVTPSAITNQIQKLEESLGVRLFRRLNRRVELTDAGAKYYVRMRLIFNDIEHATIDVVQKGDEKNVVTLAVAPTLLQQWLLPYLNDFYEHFPDINLRVIDTLRHLDLEREGVDIAIRYGFCEQRAAESHFLFSEEIVPICSPELLASGRVLAEPEHLSQFRWIYTERRLVQWENYLALGGYKQVKSAEKVWFLNSTLTLNATVNAVGVALFNKHFAQPYINNGSLIIPFELTNLSYKKASYFCLLNRHTGDKKVVHKVYEWIKTLPVPQSD